MWSLFCSKRLLKGVFLQASLLLCGSEASPCSLTYVKRLPLYQSRTLRLGHCTLHLSCDRWYSTGGER